jgi:hypothetical protein
METKKLILCVVGIAIILAVVFLSQQAYSRGFGGNLVSAAADQASAYLSKGSGWVMSNIYPKITGEVQKRGDIIKTEVNQAKQTVTEDLGKKIGNYFSEIKDSILHPGQTNNNCPTQTPQTTSGQ